MVHVGGPYGPFRRALQAHYRPLPPKSHPRPSKVHHRPPGLQHHRAHEHHHAHHHHHAHQHPPAPWHPPAHQYPPPRTPPPPQNARGSVSPAPHPPLQLTLPPPAAGSCSPIETASTKDRPSSFQCPLS